MAPIRVAVFAHNEERGIIRCLESVLQGTAHPERIAVKVLINGSRDRTEALVRDFAVQHGQFQPVLIPLGDKANAWNTYVYAHAGEGSNHIFMDGDVWVTTGAFDVVQAALQGPGILAVAPLPIGVSESLRDFLRTNHLICGTMYAVKDEFLQHVRSARVKIPIGFIGDDSAVATFLLTNLHPRFQDWQRERVRVLELVGPVIPRHRLFSWRTFRLQYRRLKRYALRELQGELFNYYVRTHGLETLPGHVTGLYRHWNKIGLRPYIRYRGQLTPFNLSAAWTVLSHVAWNRLRHPASPPANP